MAPQSQTNPVTRPLLIQRGLRVQCPNCGIGGLFRGAFKIRYRCTSCGLKLSRSDGFFLGAMVWNYGLTVFGVLMPIVVIGFIQSWSLESGVVACLAAGFIMPMVLYRLAWSLWLMSYYWFLPHELPANCGDSPAIDEDE